MTHGITIIKDPSESRALKPRSISVIGLIATASAAVGQATTDLNAAFPVGEPVLVTDIRTAIEDAGSGGTLADALSAIADVTSPVLVVVRAAIAVDPEDQPAATIAAVQALTEAEASTGVRPRIIGAPGLDVPEVVAEIAITCSRLRAFAYYRPDGDDVAAVVLDRENYGADEIMPIWPNWSSAFEGDAIARALGLRARLDVEVGYNKTISNVVVPGVTGIDRTISWSLAGDSGDAAVLNGAETTTLIRRNGFRYWGNRTCSATPDYAFESAVRTRHVLWDMLEEVSFPYVDAPLTRGIVKHILETVNAAYRAEVVAGRAIGAELTFDDVDNPPEQLAAGRAKWRCRFTPTAPLENPQFGVAITDFFYTGFADQLG